MKKRLLLGVLTICNIPLLQAADVGYATDASPTDVQGDIVREEVEAPDDGKELVHAFDMKLVREEISKRLPQGGLCSELFTAHCGEWIASVAYNRDETKLLIGTSGGVVIRDINTGDESRPFTANAGEWIASVTYSDETKLLIGTSRGVVIRDINTGDESRPFTANDGECIASVTYNRDKTKLLIGTDRRVVIRNMNTGDESRPFTANDGECIASVTYNRDKTRLLIGTDRRVVIRYIKREVHQSCTTDEDIYSVAYNGTVDETKLLIPTDRRVVSWDIKTDDEELLFTANAGEWIASVAYNRGETKLLIGTSRGVVIRDIKTGDEYRPFTANSGEYIKSVTYNGDETKLLIRTDERIVICDLLNGWDIQQQPLLLRALESWQQDKPYSIGYNELKIYRSLLDKLQKPELFDLEKVYNRLYINNVPVNIELPSMASLLYRMFGWDSNSQE